MTEDVLVSVRGFHQTDQPEQDEVEMVSAGKYYLKNEKQYILYDEVIDDSKDAVKNRIILKNDCVEVQKKGQVSANMIFEKDKKNVCWYHTPFGDMQAGILVRTMGVEETENLIEIKIDYELELNGQHAADSRIHIRIMAKNSGLFRLR